MVQSIQWHLLQGTVTIQGFRQLLQDGTPCTKSQMAKDVRSLRVSVSCAHRHMTSRSCGTNGASVRLVSFSDMSHWLAFHFRFEPMIDHILIIYHFFAKLCCQVVNFLCWAAEPAHDERKLIGLKVGMKDVRNPRCSVRVDFGSTFSLSRDDQRIGVLHHIASDMF